ncbi:MAG: hypothetical protein IT306_08345 [Chloroflexi bacterium]|nr:hypothetical protein [Chloroflexota bacterium]
MKLVLYLGWPSALALVVYVAGLTLGQFGMPPGRRISTTVYGKYEALGICVQSVTGEASEAELARGLVDAAVGSLDLPGSRRFTLPALIDAGCPGEPSHYGATAKARRVADRPDGRGQTPSPYQLHVYIVPRASLQMLGLEADLQDRRMTVEEYTVEGREPNVVLNGVTFGLYVTTAELADSQAVYRFFLRALSMHSQLGAPPRPQG